MSLLEKALDTTDVNVEEILKIEKDHMVPALVHYYKEPILLTEGDMGTLTDAAGRSYIDMFGGVCTVWAGHNHPYITDALKRQLDKLGHTTTLYPTVPMALYAKKLAEMSPEGLEKCFFVNSGSEANEAAIHMTKKYTGSNIMCSLNEAFHGRTLMVMGLTQQGSWKQNVPYPSGVIGIPNANCYRCDFGKDPETCDVDCARFADKMIKCQTAKKIAGLIVEPIQGVGGIVFPKNPEYMNILYEIVKKYDGLFISDEVQTGFGRTGEGMWGIEYWDVEPDIMTMAKSIGSGFPIGAFITRDEIADCLKPKDLFSTFGGNPLASIAGLANLELIEKEDFIGQAKRKGAVMRKRLEEIYDEHRLVGDIRGMGFMQGMEFVTDRKTKEPAPDETLAVMEHCKEGGLLVGKGGLFGNVIRLQPPIALTEEQIRDAMDILEEAIGKAEKGTRV